MRFLHTSDWHLGRTLHGVDLLDAQADVLNQICQLVAHPSDGVPVEAVLIAGDVYDRAVPPVEAVALFASTLAELTRHSTVIVTAGNHDSAIRLGFGAELFTERLRVRTDPAAVGSPVLLGNGPAQVAIYPLPYLDPDVARAVLAPPDQPLERSHQAVLTAAMDRVRHDLASRPPGTRSVVLAHAFVVGGLPSESERAIVVGGVDSVAAGTFDGVDYVALGHLHGAQQPRGSAGTVLRYSGSPLRYSFSELTHTKSVTLVDLAPEAPVRITEVALRQPREMVELTGELADLLADDRHRADWVQVTVTDRSRPDQLFDRLKFHFPHLLRMTHSPLGAQPTGELAATAAVQSPRQLGADFIEHVTGLAALEVELELFERAYQSASTAEARPGGG
ncbi:MAG TPA: exonuclease SbcCD subunit D [Jatrophihabitans sp.]|jgi:exonuclease SbcD|uniref:exonuclease SbcCD subunit D n=1 Tax=Jatrophihabitans sp. TaxID=1932789 RepID=UPI002F0100B7